MRRVCPQCQGAFEAQFLCPNCGVQLLELSDKATALAAELDEEIVRTRGLGMRMAAGLILGQGLYYGLQQMWAALALSGLFPEGWSASVHPLLIPALQVLSVVAGGMMAGAGNVRGVLAGAAIGILNAVAFVAPIFMTGNRPADFLVFGAWLPLAVFGGAGGLIARQVWPSLSDMPEGRRAKVDKKKSKKPKEPPPPLLWLRILGGAALSVGCTVWAGSIRDAFISFGGGSFILESRLQAQFVAWIISALAMLLGGALAGATSHSGLKHGFLVGFVASVGLFLIHQEIVHETLPAEQFFAGVFGLAEETEPSPMQTGAFLLTNTLLLGTAGGWFGGSLLPRIVGRRAAALDRGAI